MIVDVYVDDGEVRLPAAVEKQFVHSVKRRGDLDGLDPAGYVDGGLLLWGQRQETQPLVGVGGGRGHELAVYVLAVLVEYADFQAVAK